MDKVPNGNTHQLQPHERWLTIKEVTEMFKISPSTLTRLRKNQQLAVSKPVRKVLINMGDMLKLLEENRM